MTCSGFRVAGRERRPSVALVLALCLVLQLPAGAADIVVDGNCSLVDAVTAANSDTPVGGCPAGNGSDTLTLTEDVVLDAVDNETLGPNGLPTISSVIEIEGDDHTITRLVTGGRDDARFRIFHVEPAADLTLRNTTVSNGDDFFSYYGGAAILNRGTLLLEHTTLSGNRTFYGNGGGLRNLGGTATIESSSISDNGAFTGGGIANEREQGRLAVLTLVDSVVSENFYSGSDRFVDFGLGIFNDARMDISGSSIVDHDGFGAAGILNLGTATMTSSTVSGNRAVFAGGIENEAQGTFDIIDSTISHNEAVYYCCYYFSGGDGAGITNSGALTVTNSTLSGNAAILGARGGGLFNESTGVATLTNVTLSGNGGYSGGAVHNAGSVSVANTLIANSPEGGNCDGAVIDDGNNLADDTTCGPVPDGLTGLDPVLADNGGPTLTHALLAGSPAIDLAGDCGLPTDQRGEVREIPCDSGAFEFGSAQAPLGGSITGLAGAFVQCRNLATGQQVVGSAGSLSWDCGTLGLEFGSGDRISMSISGPASGQDVVTASVAGATGPFRWQCRNNTTGQQVAENSANDAFDCEAAGLIVSANDRIRVGIGSFVE